MTLRYAAPLVIATLLCCTFPVRSQTAPLPDGNGKAIVETRCTGCHTLAQVTRAGYDADGWRNVVAMMRNAGAQITPGEVDTVVAYLVKNFPPKAAPPAMVLAGSAQAIIREWAVPTPGSRPHDPLAAADGSIWYTGQMASVLGRLDPKTGTFKEYHTSVPDSGPHGLTMDKAGNVWFTANFKGYIGKLDPKTGTFTEYKLDPAARDPHTPIFDRNGMLWFTVQGADMVGRLDPSTGQVNIVTVPTPRANPYGMVVDSHNLVWFVEFGSNKIASIDNQMHITEHTLPNPGARPRRVAIAPDDTLWYTDYARGYLGRFDPKTGAVTEYASPGGPNSRPYGIAWLKNAVWYSESGVTPNTLVRFEPGAARFQSWTIPSGGGVVRNMMPTTDGQNLVLACSGVNRVALVEVK